MNNILVKEQYGFRSNSNMEKASYKLIDEILTVMNNKLPYMLGAYSVICKRHLIV
jgi:hypothetical protein